VELEWAMDRVAELIKKTRDETFIEKLPKREAREHDARDVRARWRDARQRVQPRMPEVLAWARVVAIENQARI